jgi:hypothetical protein
MKKILFLLFITTIAFAVNPKSIHYSALGKYLVNENGQRTKIEGHPRMVCYRGSERLHGIFLKEEGSTIWLEVPTIPPSGEMWIVKIDKPICDIISE